MDEARVRTDASSAATTSIVTKGLFEFRALKLLHLRYPGHQIDIEALRALVVSRQRCLVIRLLAGFPERYNERSAVLTTIIAAQSAAPNETLPTEVLFKGNGNRGMRRMRRWHPPNL